MKMVENMDMYCERYFAADTRPLWMKDERIDYCESTSTEGYRHFLWQVLFGRKAAKN